MNHDDVALRPAHALSGGDRLVRPIPARTPVGRYDVPADECGKRPLVRPLPSRTLIRISEGGR
ncbi:hypothetical protein [Kitasatospora sp. GP82]|uniref:hypothetical protein n=1 Tax=Kitasatospora sp. GP82 TaxID=3035089 RepID=UPI002475C8DC|nr:hypothetical protein [Kitasatospora sp. GP82]MDH6124602.1 hypothetical protein [Kitasatospora sp. GP82]